MPAEPSRAVFLSYASQDAEVARRICDSLRAAGVEVWFDQNELVGGDAWDTKIRKQIKECALFVPIISANTEARREGYFRLEWKLAAQRTHTMADGTPFLLPVVIDDTRDGAALVPEEFRAVQWIRLTTPAALQTVAGRVRRLLGLEGQPHPAEPPQDGAAVLPTRRPPRQNQVYALALAAVTLVAIIAGAWGWRTRSQPGGERAASDRSVAVLAFTNLSDDKSNEYFSDGVSEELLHVLTKVPGLKVSGRTSAFFFKGKNASVPEIGRQLGVAYVVDGSVRRTSDKVRITAQLIKTADGFHVWSDTFTRDLKDIFDVQSELARTIVDELRKHLGSGLASPATHAADGGTRNLEAHELYLRARYLINKLTLEDIHQSQVLLRKAVEVDPRFAIGWTELSRAGRLQGGYATLAAEVQAGFSLARNAAERALAISPNLAQARMALLEVQVAADFDWNGAAATLRQAQAITPGGPELIRGEASLAFATGDIKRAAALYGQLAKQDPMNADLLTEYAYTLLANREFTRAEAAFRQIVEFSAESAWGHPGIGLAQIAQKRFDEAEVNAQRGSVAWARDFVLTMAQWGKGRVADAEEVMRRLIAQAGDVAAYQIACAYAQRGDADRAFEWLERAHRQRDPGLSWSKADYFLSAVHHDPRWPAFLRQLGLHDEQLRK